MLSPLRQLRTTPHQSSDIYSSGTVISIFTEMSVTFNLSRLDIITDVLGTSSIHSTSNAESCSKNLLDTTLKRLTHRLELHCSSNFNNLIQGNVSTVFDVLLLLSVTRRFFKSTDDEGGSRGDNGYLSLSILNSEFDSNSKTFPVSCGL